MSIRTMTTPVYPAPANVTIIHNYPGAEAGMVHSKRCPHYRDGRVDTSRFELTPECAHERMCITSGEEDWDVRSACTYRQPLHMVETHKGLVLSLGERNGYDDSDFYAVVWNPELGQPETIVYASTRGWTYPNSATVDATPEVCAAYEAWQARCAAERAERARVAAEAAKAKREALESERARIASMKGKTVKVGKRQGTLFWVGISKSGDSVRVGIKTSDGSTHWGAGSSVKPM